MDVDSVQHHALRRSTREFLAENGQGWVNLGMTVVSAPSGARNRLWVEVDFPESEGATPSERQAAALDTFFGANGDPARAKRHEELVAASGRAVARLQSELKPRFQKGLAEGESLKVKALFETEQGQNERLWMRVTRWQGDRVLGVLEEDPANIPGLRTGSEVDMSEDLLIDYLHQLPDGSTEGDETGALMKNKKRPGKKAP